MVSMLILDDIPYSDRVPIQNGTTVIDRVMGKITVKELAKAGTIWCQTIGSTAITRQTKVSEPSFDATNIESPLVTTKCVVCLCSHEKN